MYSYLARSWTALGGSVMADRSPESFASASSVSGTASTATYTYPNGPDNALILSRLLARESSMTVRGTLRGATYCPQGFSTETFSWRSKIDDGVSGRRYIAVKGYSPASTWDTVVTQFFDITGPWE